MLAHMLFAAITAVLRAAGRRGRLSGVARIGANVLGTIRGEEGLSQRTFAGWVAKYPGPALD
jgi:hypothetical protein